MGLLRSLAKKVVGRVTGQSGAASNAANVRPSPPPPPVAAPAAAPPSAASLHSAPAAAQVMTTDTAEPVVENAEALSTIECGVQEILERVGAGEPVTILDVREPSETAGGVIPGAILIPLGQLRARWEEVKDANEIVCYCAVGARSLQAAHFLREKGLFNATSMDGGFSAWQERGGPVVRPS
jgi:rhodanese-related sulfurtransferase